jgi:hypothetical protein
MSRRRKQGPQPTGWVRVIERLRDMPANHGSAIRVEVIAAAKLAKGDVGAMLRKTVTHKSFRANSASTCKKLCL